MPVKKSQIYSALWEACNKLRGGVEPARYKDYVLVLLFHKYVSDRYKGAIFGDFTVTEATSFDALVRLKGDKDIGEKVTKILEQFLADNGMQGQIFTNFNNSEELGSGKELVDKVSGLIGVFENPALDFSANTSGGDDIIGDAYEYFMMKFAQESGKSKGQFYTPGEVSRVIARLIGIDSIPADSNHLYTLYDPACGSGSLLLRADDEAPRKNNGKDSAVTIFGQEVDKSTSGLAKMNAVLHGRATADIRNANTLSNPLFTDSDGRLKTFDFVVMNPPFSDKSWSDGVDTENDSFGRFKSYGVPPEKNGDYAWFLHVLASLNASGKAGIVMPHGVLFRGNAEEVIRRKILATHCIKGIISLPGNLFYGTGIPACIIIIDKENAQGRTGIFFIDAGEGFRKDGSKNRLREQDIEKIVRVFKAGQEIEGYSRFVTYSEIERNGGNLNVPRYIRKPESELPHDIAAHLAGGIPKRDIDSLSELWEVSPELKTLLITEKVADPDVINLGIMTDRKILGQMRKERKEFFEAWREEVRPLLMAVKQDVRGSPDNADTKALIRELGERLLGAYSESVITDKFGVFDCLMNYWNEQMQDDVYMIKAYGWEKAGRMTEEGRTDKGKVKSWEGAVIPREVMEREFFPEKLAEIAALSEEAVSLGAEIEESRGGYENEEDMPDEEQKDLAVKAKRRREAERRMRQLRSELDGEVLKKYAVLREEEIRVLVFGVKWMGRLSGRIGDEVSRAFGWYHERVVEIARRYERSLPEILVEVEGTRAAVEGALGRMGYTW